MELWDEVPEAEQFYESVMAALEEFKLFAAEEFTLLQRGIVATSDVDSQGEAFAPEALEETAAGINARSLSMWLGYQHDPLIHPQGRIVAARVFYAPQSRVHFVGGVIGLYDPTKMKSFNNLGIDVSTLPLGEASELPAGDEGQLRLWFNPAEFDEGLINGILADAPDMVSRKPGRSVRKAAEPLAIITLCAPLVGFLGVLGKKSGDAFFAWLSRMLGEIAKSKRERVLLEFDSPYKGCEAQFVMDPRDKAVLCEAVSPAVVEAAFQSAMSLIDRLHDQEPTRVVYAYDVGAKKWLPRYVTTQRAGVITDEPYLVTLDQNMGLSIGGTVPDE